MFIHKMFVSILQRKSESTEYFVQVTKTLTVKKTVEQQKVYKIVEILEG